MSTDAELAEGLALHGSAGLEAVYTAYAARLYTYALTMLRDPTAAQDVVHDALLAAAGSIGQLRDPLKFRPWLYAITRNECLRTLRGRQRFSGSDEVLDMADTSIDLDAGLRREEAARLVGQALAAMSPADRDIVALALQHDLDVDRISEVTGTAPNTVHARLSRARTGLSEAVGALVLYRSRGRCEQLQSIIHSGDQPLTPLLRKRIQRHVKSCDECETRRRAALAAVGPAMAAPLYITPPDALRQRIAASLHQGDARRLAGRAAPFDGAGFPEPLDAHNRARWVAPGAVAGVGLMLVLAVLAVRPGGDDAAPGTLSPGIATLAAQPQPTPSATRSADTSRPSDESGPTATVEARPSDPVPGGSAAIAKTPTSSERASPAGAGGPSVRTSKKPSSPAEAGRATPKPAKPAESVESDVSPAPTETMSPEVGQESPAPVPAPPIITVARLVDEDQAGDGSFSRCDAFRLTVSVSVSGAVDRVEAEISPFGTTVTLSGDPLAVTTTLPPGEHSVSIRAIGPGGTRTLDAGNVVHICPG